MSKVLIYPASGPLFTAVVEAEKKYDGLSEAYLQGYPGKLAVGIHNYPDRLWVGHVLYRVRRRHVMVDRLAGRSDAWLDAVVKFLLGEKVCKPHALRVGLTCDAAERGLIDGLAPFGFVPVEPAEDPPEPRILAVPPALPKRGEVRLVFNTKEVSHV